MNQKRLVSGIQPTGKMHLGNYFGAVSNWVRLQDDFEAFYFLADLHSLTSVYEDPSQVRQDKLNLAMDLLACGLDPQKCCLFIQSDVPEHSELHLILSMITPLPWLLRVPTYKGKKEELKNKDLDTYGFLGYPVLQAADIIIYKALFVPVGEDQLPHLELTREIVRRFNSLYKINLFPEPQAQLTSFPVLPGLDGRKMSKSYANTIPISATPAEVEKLVLKMLTDPARKLRTDKGNPDICPVFQYHKLLNTQARQSEIAEGCRSASIGCVDCKKECAGLLLKILEPIYMKRQELAKAPDYVKGVLKKGSEKARTIAAETLVEVKKAVGL